MTQVVGVRFRRAGKVYFYDPAGLSLGRQDSIIAQTQRGTELGWVVIPPQDVVQSQLREGLHPILRQAAASDREKIDALKARANQALVKAREVARRYASVKLVRAEFAWDESYLTIEYGADEKADVRDLARELNTQLDLKVELRQLGPREHAKALGGFGWCGQELCCTRWLVDIKPVTIKMAKDQGLPLNPSKLAGNCGRLRCCLRFEVETYLALRQGLPRVGQYVVTSKGTGRIRTVQVLKETVGVVLDEGGMSDFKASEVKLDEARIAAAALGPARTAAAEPAASGPEEQPGPAAQG